MRIARTLCGVMVVLDDHDEIVSPSVDHRGRRDGVLFVLRGWDIRYRPGERRVTEAVFDVVVDGEGGRSRVCSVGSEWSSIRGQTYIAPPLAVSRT